MLQRLSTKSHQPPYPIKNERSLRQYNLVMEAKQNTALAMGLMYSETNFRSVAIQMTRTSSFWDYKPVPSHSDVSYEQIASSKLLC